MRSISIYKQPLFPLFYWLFQQIVCKAKDTLQNAVALASSHQQWHDREWTYLSQIIKTMHRMCIPVLMMVCSMMLWMLDTSTSTSIRPQQWLHRRSNHLQAMQLVQHGNPICVGAGRSGDDEAAIWSEKCVSVIVSFAGHVLELVISAEVRLHWERIGAKVVLKRLSNCVPIEIEKVVKWQETANVKINSHIRGL